MQLVFAGRTRRPATILSIGTSSSVRASGLLKKTHMLRCAQSPRYNVLAKYASARRFVARLASEIFLSSPQIEFF